jgi:cytochrome c-type biogenesis protein CcmE
MRNRRAKLLAGGVVIAAALGYLVWSGMSTAVVYFVTPSELVAQGPEARGRPLRLGGMVEAGSVVWDPRALALSFRLTDGRTAVPVAHAGAPPDLFAERQGAVVEGRLRADGTFEASTIMAKHSEEYMPPKAGETPAFEKGKYRPAPDARAASGGAAARPPGAAERGVRDPAAVAPASTPLAGPSPVSYR